VVDQLVGQRLLSGSSSGGRLDVYGDYTARLDRLYSDADTGIGGAIDSFFAGLSRLSSDPASSAVRTEVLGAAEDLAANFRRIGTALNDYGQEIEQRLSVSVSEVNRLAEDIASFNSQIALARGTGTPPNDLLDKRDLALQQMADLVDIKTVTQDSGDINVFTGSGQALVLSGNANALGLRADEFDGSRAEVVLRAGGQIVPLGDSISGGRIGGLLDVRGELDQDQGRLGRMAAAVALQVNEQHQQGVDARGQLGGELFSGALSEVRAASTNTGTATPQISLTDVSALTGDSYDLRFNGGYELVNRRTGEPVALTGSGTPADPLVGEGFSITVPGTPANGDRFLLQPTHGAAMNLSVAFGDPTRLAAAGLMRAEPATQNIGTAQASLTVNDAATAVAQTPASIEFIDANTYSVDGAGAFAYDAAAGINVNGFNLRLEGDPVAGDRFDLNAAGPNSGDNRNALAMAALGDRASLAGGTRSFSDENAGLVASAGDRARQAERQAQATGAILAQDRAQRDSVSGVNLDEEAANLLRFQQGYQAAARVIDVANQMFQSLLSAVSR
jgi:flagellar hook-associated protein 1 FlgK